MSDVIEARVTVGDFDEAGCWHPRWRDENGQWHDGWGWWNEAGEWQVEHGYYDRTGEWVAASRQRAEQVPVTDDLVVDELPMIGRFDRQPVPFFGASAAVHAVFLILAMTMPDSARAMNLDGYDSDDRFVQMALTEFQKDEPRVVPGWANDGKPEEEAAKHAGEEGEAGEPEETVTDRRMAVKGPADNEDLEIAKARDREITMSSGIASQVTSLYAAADRSIGADASHALGNLDAHEPGEARGFGGLGIRWDGGGGGGDDWQSLGASDIGTSGLSGVDRGCKGVRCGVGAGHGPDVGDRRPGVPEPQVTGDVDELTGGLDREIIRRVVRQHRRELKYCYEKELQKDKTLRGELVVKFTIAGDGNVVAAVNDSNASSLKNASIAHCVTGKIRRWVFPRQQGNDGIVIVKYPFRFHKG